MELTKKSIVDNILNLVERFGRTDDSRKDETWLSQKIDEVRAEIIAEDFQKTGLIDRSWLTDMGLQTTHQVNLADDPTISYNCGSISKLTIPSVISLKKGNADLGIYSLTSPLGVGYYYFPMSAWSDIPSGHIRSKFNYYDRINTALYINKEVSKVRPVLVLESPEEGYIVSSEPVASGDLVNGTTYIVKFHSIIYNGAGYKKNEEFTAGASDTFTGLGKVYLKSQLTLLTETKPYPLSLDKIRQLIIEICVKEFQIERQQLTDVKNDSKDDTVPV